MSSNENSDASPDGAQPSLSKLRKAFNSRIQELDELRGEFFDLISDVASAREEAVVKEKLHWQLYYDKQFSHLMTCELNVKSNLLTKAQLAEWFDKTKAEIIAKKAHEANIDHQIEEKSVESEKITDMLRRMKAFTDNKLNENNVPTDNN